MYKKTAHASFNNAVRVDQKVSGSNYAQMRSGSGKDMGITAILVMFQVYGCNSFHMIIGPVNTYPRPSCHFFPCKSLCFQN